MQNEKRVKLLLEYEENLPGSDNFHAIDSTEDSDDPVCKWNISRAIGVRRN